MFLPKQLLRISLLLLAALTIAARGATPKAAPTTFVPTISAVTADSITVVTGRNAGVKQSKKGKDGNPIVEAVSNVKTYKIAKACSITLNGLPATAADLAAKMVVSVIQGGSPDTVSSIVANTTPPALQTPAPPAGPTPAAPAKAAKAGPAQMFKKIVSQVVVSVTPKIITVGVPGTLRARAYYVTPATRITVNHAPAEISAVQAGMEVEVVAGSSTTVESISAKSR